MKVNFNLKQKAAAIVLLPFLFQIAMFLKYNAYMREVEVLAEEEHHSRDVIDHVDQFGTLLSTDLLSLSAHSLANKADYLTACQVEWREISSELKTLQELVSTDSEQARNCAALTDATKKLMSDLASQHTSAAFERFDPLTSPEFTQNLAAVLAAKSKLLAEEKRHELGDLEAVAEREKQTDQLIEVGISVNLAAALFLITLFSRSVAARLEVLTDNAIKLARNEPLGEAMTGSDEIARLDSVFHTMADALAASSKRERAIFDHAADVICSLDSSKRITEVNPACMSAWGYQPEDLVGKYYLNLVDQRYRDETAQALDEGAKSNERFLFENEILCKDASLVSIRWSAYWAEKEQGYFCVAHDITQQKYVEQLKAQFTSMITHDLRSPLTSIMSFLELLISGVHGPLPPDVVRSSTLVQRSTKRLIALVNDLLDLDRLESGALPLEFKESDITEIVEESVNAIADLAESKGITINTNEVESHHINADPGRISQVLVNLLSNAIKFSARQATVRISAAATDGFLKVSVIDTGRGVPEHLRSVLFDRFKQIEVSDAKTGSGLGLAICKAIVEQHGGKIGVDSSEGKGSCFWFTLPLSVEQIVAAPENALRRRDAMHRPESA